MAGPIPDQQEPSPERVAPWRSIRLQISLLLLGSALNGAVILALAVAAIAGTPPPDGGSTLPEVDQGLLAGTPVAAFSLAWVVGFSLLTVLSAFRLQYTLSRPLERLARAADRVAAGALDTPIPVPRSSTEFSRLASALEAMRGHLVGSIDRLDSQNAEMAAMLRSLSDGVLMVDSQGRVVEFNASAARIAEGLVPARPPLAEGVGLVSLLPELGTDLRGTAAAGRTRIDVALEGAGRRHLVVEVTAVDTANVGTDRAFVVVVRDVSRTVEADQIKRDFLSVVTHELKTPLTAVQGFAKLLLMGKGGDPTPQQADLMRRIVAQSEVLRAMIDDLLDATRLEGGNLSIAQTTAPARDLLNQAHRAFEGAAMAGGVALAVEDRLPDGVAIHVDAARFQQILGNYVRNALKFTPRGGRITLGAALVGDEVAFHVEDTGVGIPEEALPRLFKKFYQVDRGDTRNQGGAGLGLYICSQLARAMGGRVGVTSSVGTGSRFTVTVPRAVGGG